MSKPVTINGVELDFDAAVALSKAAEESATALGYRAESRNVARNMGLPTEGVKVTISFVVDAKTYRDYPERFVDPANWSISQDYTGMSRPRGKTVKVTEPKYRIDPTS